MIGSVLGLFTIVIIMKIDCTTRVGYIYNASYTAINATLVRTYQNACSECICYGLLSNVSTLYVGFNCYKSNKTCAFFANYSSSTVMRNDADSTFIFVKQPPSQNTTTVSFPLNGVTVAGYGNGTAGNANNALAYPWGLVIGQNGQFFVSDYGNYRVMKMKVGNFTGSIVAGIGIQGTTATKLSNPAEIAVDAASNIYVADTVSYRVMLWGNNSASGVRVVGNGSFGSSNTTIGASVGLAVDSQRNIYVADYSNHRVMKWAVNATFGSLVAGVTGVSGNTNQYLNRPYGLYLDENNSYIYIADLNNHRIQRYRLGITANGTTVAGGNGAGSASNQLNTPYDVCVSKNTGDVYVADFYNNRIQRWRVGATSGITIVGITGVSGTNATLLSGPANVALDMNETFLYVSDMNNHRVQRYRLP